MDRDELRTLQRPLKERYSEEQLDTLIRLTERCCVVFQTIANAPEFTVSRNAV